MLMPITRPLYWLTNPVRKCARTAASFSPKAKVGVDLIRDKLKEDVEEECLFRTIRDLDVNTSSRVHQFNVPCDRVMKFIKIGAINKVIATQYCHYLAHLCRTSDHNDLEFYAKRSIDLMDYLIRNHKDFPNKPRIRLLCDIAHTDLGNCKNICRQLIEKDDLQSFSQDDFVRILEPCYKFGLWDEAHKIVTNDHKLRSVNFGMIDHLVRAVISASETYVEMKQRSEDDASASLRNLVLEHLYEVLGRSSKIRLQFVTQYKKEFIKALTDLDFNVVINPTIKMSGRCCSCNNHLPLFDTKQVQAINSSTRSLIMKGSDKDLFLHSSPSDNSRFESFLQDMFKEDRKPIDLVIDGLNIAYRNSVGVQFVKVKIGDDIEKTTRVRSQESMARVLINTIIRGNMLEQFRKILVVGKWHMTKWPGLMEFFEKHNIHFYSSYNNSQDDLYQLFASTLSPKTLLVTGDYFRDHLAQLKLEDRVALERWIDTHQVWIDYKGLKPIWPTPYEKIPSVDRDSGCFHVPIVDYNYLKSMGDHEPPPHLNNKLTTWICCTVNKASPNVPDDGDGRIILKR